MARTPSPGRRSSLSPAYVVLGAVALVAVGLLLYQAFGADETVREPVEVAATPAEISRTPGIAVGREDAPVVIYQFADYMCPHCATWATMVEPLVKQRLVEEGLVRYVFYDFPIGGHFRHSFLAARAGRCANEQGKFWEYHDVLFGRQPTWSAMGDPSDFFVEVAEQVGLDEDQFEQCLRSDKYAREVTLSRKLGEQLGVQGTPSIFINGERIPEIPDYAELERLVRERAGAAGGAAAPAAS